MCRKARVLVLDGEKCHRYRNLVFLFLNCQKCPYKVIFHLYTSMLEFLYSYSNFIFIF